MQVKDEDLIEALKWAHFQAGRVIEAQKEVSMTTHRHHIYVIHPRRARTQTPR
jgi:hypothetical protein